MKKNNLTITTEELSPEITEQFLDVKESILKSQSLLMSTPLGIALLVDMSGEKAKGILQKLEFETGLSYSTLRNMARAGKKYNEISKDIDYIPTVEQLKTAMIGSPENEVIVNRLLTMENEDLSCGKMREIIKTESEKALSEIDGETVEESEEAEIEKTDYKSLIFEEINNVKNHYSDDSYLIETMKLIKMYVEAL